MIKPGTCRSGVMRRRESVPGLTHERYRKLNLVSLEMNPPLLSDHARHYNSALPQIKITRHETEQFDSDPSGNDVPVAHLVQHASTLQAGGQSIRQGAPSALSPSAPNLVQYAKPMCGTTGDANTFPGAVAPFGMIQWSPDTEAGMREGGYSDRDTRISDFSLDHISGAGCDYGEDFAVHAHPGRGTNAADRKPHRLRHVVFAHQ